MESRKKKRNSPVVITYEFSESEVPKSYSEIVINIIKYIACQKQIPYPYDYLKFVSTKKEAHSEEPVRLSSKKARNMKKASETFEAMETLFQHLTAELESIKRGEVQEVMVLLGATPFSAKEAYIIQLPPLPAGEKQSSVKNLSLRFIRHLMKSDEFYDLISRPLNPTNVYVFVKKPAGRRSEWLLPKDEYQIPQRCLQAVFSFTHNLPSRILNKGSDKSSFDVYCDETTIFGCELEDDQKPSENMKWYQSRIMFKGFKNYTEKLPVLALNSVRGPCVSKQ